MIEKVYEDRFGTIHYTGLAKDLEIIKTNPKYLFDKANGSKFYNIENLSNSLIWDKENKKWIDYDYNSEVSGGSTEKTYTDEEVNTNIDNVLINF